MSHILILGASRGLGAALAYGVPAPGETVWCVARSRPDVLDACDGIDRRWIAADLSDPRRIADVFAALADSPLELLIYNAGIWEANGFEQASEEEIVSIVNVNLTSLLLTARRALPLLRRGKAPRLVLVGSTCGLENEGTTSVAYAATKFAMRGAAHALRELLRKDGIPVTVLSPGSMATDLPFDAAAEEALERHGSARIPAADIVALVRTIRALSPASCLKEIHLPAVADDDV